MRRIIGFFAVLLLFLCGCSQNGELKEFNVGTFSYLDDCAKYEGDPGVSTTNFVNTEKVNIQSAEQAVEYAKKECKVEYDTIDVDFDADTNIYRVSFCIGPKDGIVCAGGNQDVYINHEGITQLIVSGE